MTINITTHCPICHNDSMVVTEYEDYIRYKNGEMAQDCFPYLSIAEREKLISGICLKCWDKTFGL